MKLISRYVLSTCALMSLGFDVGAVDVVITDSSGVQRSCGSLDVLNQNSSRITITTLGTCITSTGGGVQDDVTDGGTDGSTDGSTGGGTDGSTGGGTDGSTGGSTDGSSDGDTGGSTGGSGFKCTSSGNVTCKGYTKILELGGSLQDIPMKQGEIHVWEFKYVPISSFTDKIKALGIESTVDLEFTINQNAGSMDASSRLCEHKKNYIAFSADKSKFWACRLIQGETYFLNIRNMDSFGGEYTIVR